MGSSESNNSGGGTKGLFQRVLRFVSHKDSDKSHSDEPSPEEKTQMLLRKQRYDVARRGEFGELRGMIQAQEGEEESRLSSSMGRKEKPNSRQLETIRKINELENEMANRLSLQQLSEPSPGSSKQVVGPSTMSSSIQADSSNFNSSFYSATESTSAGSIFPLAGDYEGARSGMGMKRFTRSGQSDSTADVLDAIDSVSGTRDDIPNDNELGLLADPMLEENAVLFASNEDELVERNLRTMLAKDSAYRNNRISWQVLMDFYRATGNQAAFDALAMDYTTLFSESAPQWVVFDPVAVKKLQAKSATSGMIYWQSPAIFDEAAALDMDQKFSSENEKIPRLMDWNLLKEVTGKSAHRVLQVLKSMDRPGVELQVTGLSVILAVLEQLIKVSSADKDSLHSLWLLRLELMRFFNEPEEFDMMAMEYCLEFEVSPPDWVKPQCSREDLDKDGSSNKATMEEAVISTQQGATTILTHLATGFYSQVAATPFRLRGELKGSMAKELSAFEEKISKDRGFIRINCEALVRIDFVAAGDLLNWVSEKALNGYSIQLLGVNRLVALFFIVMGVSAPAQISLRKD